MSSSSAILPRAHRPGLLHGGLRPGYAYLGSSALMASVIILRLNFAPVMEHRPIYGILLLVVMLGGFLGGLGPGLLATFLGAASVHFLMVPPLLDFGFSSLADAIQWTTFVVTGALLSIAMDALYRARVRASRVRASTSLDLTQRRVRVALAIAFIGTLAIGIASVASLARMRQLTLQMTHSYEVVGLLHEATTHLAEVEAAEFGAISTGDPRFRDRYRAASQELEYLLGRLRSQSRERPADAAALDDVVVRIRGWSTLSQQRMEAADRAGSPPTIQVRPAGADLRDQAIAAIESWRRSEYNQLVETQARAETSAATVIGLIATGAALSFSMLILIVVAVNRDFAGSRRAAAALEQAHATLEARVKERTAELGQSYETLKENQRNFEAVVAAAGDGILTCDLRGIIETANPAAEKAFGFPAGALVGCPLSAILPDVTTPAEAIVLAKESLPDGDGTGRALQGWRRDGTRFPLELTVTELKVDGLRKFAAFVRDVTARRQVEAEIAGRLQASAIISRLTKSLPGAIYVMKLAPGGRFSFPFVSEGWRDLTGLTAAEVRHDAHVVLGLIHPDDRGSYEASARASLEAMRPFTHEFRIRHPERGYIWVEARSTPDPQADGTVLWHGYTAEITGRRRSESALLESEERFSLAFRSSPAAIAINRRRDLVNVEVNDAFLAIFECTRTEIIGHTLRELDIFREPTVQEFRRRLNECGQVADCEVLARSVKGRERWVSVSIRLIELQGEACALSTFIDVTERKRSEIRATALLAITRALAEGAPVADTCRQIIEIVCRQLGWEIGEAWLVDPTAARLRCAEIWHVPGEDFDAFTTHSRGLSWERSHGLPGTVWETGQPLWSTDAATDARFVRHEHPAAAGIQTAVGVPMQLRGEVLGALTFFGTRTQAPDEKLLAMLSTVGLQLGQFIERRRLSEQFRQAQKLEAIGTLAGGIAHDFNNVLGAITGYTELARMQATDPEVMEYLQSVAEASRRAADLVRQILAFSRRQEQQRQLVPLWPIVDEALKLLRATIPKTIEFETSIDRRGSAVLADPTQIHQVMMNLVTNAAHAMQDRPGRLGVTLEQITVDAAMAALIPGLRPGPYQRLTVGDTGHGMDSSTLARIYEPFFTTKALGEGTGLGLAVVHGIVQSHDGVITVHSRPDEGTRFQLYFPSSADWMVPRDEPTRQPPVGQGQRVLVVDNEESLALMSKIALERLGYVVDAFTSPSLALDAVRTDPKKYSLVLTDLAMPRMNGTELASRLTALRPELPVILTTGFSASLTLDSLRKFGIREMALKPITYQKLGELVHRLMSPG